MIKTIEYIDGIVRMIDQTRLPLEKKFIDCRTIEEVGHAIKTMVIRGAPAIGVAAAMGASLGADSIEASRFEDFYHDKKRQLGHSNPGVLEEPLWKSYGKIEKLCQNLFGGRRVQKLWLLSPWVLLYLYLP